jgi:hypothetical protein
MIAKAFEVRDKCTFMPVVAVKCEPENESERFMLARTGYGREIADQCGYILLAKLDGGESVMDCDPHSWNGCRTMQTAHQYIIEHFDELEAGAVIDVQFILGETDSPKLSESIV